MKNELMKASTIAEAAKMLGVSNRTVYRRLKKGKLTRVKKGDTWIDIMSLSMPELLVDQINDHPISIKLTELSDTKSDTLDISADNATKTELGQRDETIARLSAENQALRETVRQLQGQMYDLARQTVAQAIQSVPQQNESLAPRQSAFAAFFARKR